MVHDLPLPATVDVTPHRGVDNLERLALAFDDLVCGRAKDLEHLDIFRDHPLTR